ncbi:hypothetical protein [Nevskia ramosa]|uniref:hypothetical protein n=1 Tax=Nevskia ramosa TaxID=64002 RepID=UPI003D0B1142
MSPEQSIIRGIYWVFVAAGVWNGGPLLVRWWMRDWDTFRLRYLIPIALAVVAGIALYFGAPK